MKKKLMFILVLFFFIGCSSDNNEGPELTPELEEIRFSSNIGSSVESRAIGIINPDYTTDLEFSMARIDQDPTTGNYPADYTASTVLNATRTGGTGYQNVALSPKQYYLTHFTNFKTKLVGWHPRKGFTASVVSFPIDGDTDIMLSNEVEGWKATGERFSDTGKEFILAHKLTQIQVSAYAVDAAAEIAWGQIRSIKVKGQHPTCEITPPATVAFTGTVADLDLVKKKISDNSTITYPLDMPVSADGSTVVECGYAMVEPVATPTVLNLVVETANGSVRDVALATQNYEESKAYVVTLKFTSAEIIPRAQIGEWVSGGSQEIPM